MKKLSRLLAVFLLALAISACGTGMPQGSGLSEAGSETCASVESAIDGEEITARGDGGRQTGNASWENVEDQSENASEDSAGSGLENASESDIGDQSENDLIQSSAGGTAERSEESFQDQESLSENESGEETLPKDGTYTAKDDVALYIHLYGELPSNFITKKEAEKLGWKSGSLEPYAPGKCIGGNRFGNYEGLLPEAEGRFYTECDIDTLGAQKRGAKRIVFSNDGLIYYTEDHYESFELLYGEE